MADEHFATRKPARSLSPAEGVWDLVTRYGPHVAGLCRAGVSLVPGVAGIGVSAGSPLSEPDVLFTSDDTSALIEDFQLTLNEGPCRDAAATQQPVVAADLTNEHWRRRWPQFTPAAVQAGVRAVFALPLHAGGMRHHGAVDLYRRTPGELNGMERDAALVFAAAATELLTLEQLNLNLTDAFIGGRPSGGPARSDVPPADAEADLPTVLLVCWFDATALHVTREKINTACADSGLTGEEDLYPFVLAVHEAMTNVVRHGGGHGQLVLWWHAESLWCEISDHGPGIPNVCLPVRSAALNPLDPRGLWLIRRACTSCKITTDATGTRLLLGYRLNHRRPY
jgi:anti-sigma regulatory factor (Ser/Thr protein kinase)